MVFVNVLSGSALIKVGQCEQRLGQTERDFISSAGHCYVQPLRKFLEGEMKTILKERSLLESRRYCPFKKYLPRCLCLVGDRFINVNPISYCS
jgi:hypothetical protein